MGTTVLAGGQQTAGGDHRACQYIFLTAVVSREVAEIQMRIRICVA
jgi:hypothetical protein